MLTPADRLRSLVKEATAQGPLEVHRLERQVTVNPSHSLVCGPAARLIALAPQLAELVADMAEALKDWEYDGLDDFLASKSVELEGRLAALFPEDSA